ncbi:MAG TPA: hypothetical protein VKH35_10305 [Thermoanaerobaculia bacterium]|nr:hypothetical protein [Thermoanaerobaculia bacterium]
MQRQSTVALLCASLLSLAIGVSPSAAAGSFHYGKVRFQPVDTFAFQAEGDGSKPVTVVVLTSFKINRPAVLDAINTVGALYEQAQNGSVVLVRLIAPHRCAVSGFLGETAQNIDLGENFPAKSTAETATRIAGECSTSKPGKLFADVYDFHLSYDVPITAIPKPKPLGAGGGEPGASYAALVKAIQANDWNGAHLRLPPEQVPSERPKGSEMKDFFEGLSLNYPKTVTVLGGLGKGNSAQIDVRGIDHDGKKIKGGVTMKKAGGQWQVVNQGLFFDM